MTIEKLVLADIELLGALQPPTWDDITPRMRYFIDSPHCIALKAVIDGQIVGVGATLFHKDSAWLANIITHEKHRNKGIGSALTQSLIDTVDQKKYSTIYLDATELGYPIYLKFGFEVEGIYKHFKKDFDVTFPVDECIKPYHEKFYKSILDLDFEVSGEYRSDKLNEGINQALIYVTAEKLRGVYFPTIGEGLIIAYDNEAGIALMKRKTAVAVKAVIPQNNLAVADFLLTYGFSFLRTSRRMRLGKKRYWKESFLYNRISGQLG